MANDPNWRLPEVPAFELTSSDFDDGGTLPTWARGSAAGGEDRSPELTWSGAPEGTRSFVLTVYDPDAPTGSGFWHWAVHGLPAGTTGVPRGAGTPDSGLLPEGAITQPNEMRLTGYAGAAPPPGDGEHRYVFTVSALDVDALPVPDGGTPAVLGFMLREHIIGRAQLTGRSES